MTSGGFSFCGTDIKELGLEYAPEMEDTYIYKPAQTSTHVETFEGHNGGYIYGAWKQPKDFVLRCFFEEKQIDKGLMAQIYNLFRAGKTGKLVFARRPWVYYYATVTEPIEEGFTNYLNGLLTIRMKAMYPFGRSDTLTNLRTDPFHNSVMKNSAAFDKEDIAPDMEYNLTEQNSSPILLANVGTERAALGFAISGDAIDGVTIDNNTTGQSCKMVALSKAETTDVNKAIMLDPISGKTVLTGIMQDPTTGEFKSYGTKELAFMHHQYGFLELEPSFPATRDLFVTYQADSSDVSVASIIRKNLIGQYISINGEWMKIVGQPNDHTLTLGKTITAAGSERTMALLMNEITITPGTTMDINIKFMFKPTYA